jgi:hypothetical protein
MTAFTEQDLDEPNDPSAIWVYLAKVAKVAFVVVLLP